MKMLRNLALVRKYSTQSKKDLAHAFATTLTLPKTEFPNRSGKNIAELTTKVSDDLYSWQSKSSELKELSIFHDGPPFANASLHLGHSLNKITKDIINRFNLLKGKKIQYRPGWDCHGLPIELKALQTLSEKAKQDVSTVLSPTEIRSIAKNHALEAIEDQKQSFRRFGVMGEWDNFYATIQRDYETRQLKVFKEMFHKGYITRKNKPVYWGTETRTALAEAELEYNDNHKSTAAYVKFPLKAVSSSVGKILKAHGVDENNTSLLIWTTTPWTLASNKAVAINLEMNYTLLHSSTHGYLVVATDLAEKVKLDDMTILKSVIFSGSDLLGTKYLNPVDNSEHAHPVLAASYVTSTVGTGLVHTAPGHGFDDYLLCKTHGIEPYSPVNSEGKYTSDLPAGCEHLSGKFVLGAGQKAMIEILKEKNVLVDFNSNYRHKYPYDWRSKKPIIIRATPQWFANIDEVKANAIEALKDVKFFPPQGRNRLEAFTASRSEWCISRQRVWGVPIPAIYSKADQEPITDVATMDHIINKISELGTDEWFVQEDDVSRWLPAEYQTKGDLYYKSSDTMDVWFDSGTSWTMLQERDGDKVADFYFEGSDQHRGWFQSSLLTKIAATPVNAKYRAPFKQVITHGFILDDKGKKMSKSLGNVISPEAVIEGQKGKWPPLGVDGLRLWVASSDYTKDVMVGPQALKNVAENMKKFRITLRFLLGALSDYKPVDFNYEQLQPIDKIALHQLKKLTNTVQEQYSAFEFNRVIQTINHHTSTHLSAFYFDIIKDRLYASAPDSVERRGAQFVLSEIFRVYLSILSPVTPLLTQEAWNYLPYSESVDSPFKRGWVDLPEHYLKDSIEEDIKTLDRLRSVVNQAIEKGRTDKKITSSLSCDILLQFDSESANDLVTFIKKYDSYLAEFFICSQVTINKTETEAVEWSYESRDSGIVAKAVPTLHHKCPRCWQYTAELEDSLCNRCDDVVKSL